MLDLSTFAPDEADCYRYILDGNAPGNGGTSDQSPNGVTYALNVRIGLALGQPAGWEGHHKAAKTPAERAYCAAQVMDARRRLDLWQRTYAKVRAMVDGSAVACASVATA